MKPKTRREPHSIPGGYDENGRKQPNEQFYRQEFIVEECDVEVRRPNYIQPKYRDYVFRPTDVGRTIVVITWHGTDKTYWTF